MLRLLFGEKASKRNNICVDLLLGYRNRFSVILRHVLVVVVEDEFLGLRQVWLTERESGQLCRVMW